MKVPRKLLFPAIAVSLLAIVLTAIVQAFAWADPRGWANDSIGGWPTPCNWVYGHLDTGGDVDGDGVDDLLVAVGRHFSGHPKVSRSSITIFSGATRNLVWTKSSDDVALGAAGIQIIEDQDGDGLAEVLVGSLRRTVPWFPRVKLRTQVLTGVDGRVMASREDRRLFLDDEAEYLRPLVAWVPPSGPGQVGAVVIADVRDPNRSHNYGALAVADASRLLAQEWISSDLLDNDHVDAIERIGCGQFLVTTKDGCLIWDDTGIRKLADADLVRVGVSVTDLESRAELPSLTALTSKHWYVVDDGGNHSAPSLVSVAFRRSPDGGQMAYRSGAGWADFWPPQDGIVKFACEAESWIGSRSTPKFFRDVGDINGDGFRDLLVGRRNSLVLKSGQNADELFAIRAPAGKWFYDAALVGDVSGDGKLDLATCIVDDNALLKYGRGQPPAILIYAISSFEGTLISKLPIPAN